MKTTQVQVSSLNGFLQQLHDRRIPYFIVNHLHWGKPEAVMVQVCVPGELWEVEFFQNGTIEVERFISTGKVENQSVFDRLFSTWTDPESASG